MANSISNFKFQISGFTLVELLVVISIIVVLLTLLTPAMDQAIYRAELAVCAARLKGIAGGMTSYAMGFKRQFPYNLYHATNTGGWHPPLMRNAAFDLRLIVAPYLPINKTFIDPMIKPLEIEATTENLVYGSYALWNGWRWTLAAYNTQMRQAKIGDRFNWKGETGTGTEYRWDILAGDFMRADVADATNHVPDGGYWSCHPSAKDTSWLVRSGLEFNNASNRYSFWISTKVGRDEVDYNVVRQDNAVEILGDVAWDDERIVDVAEYNSGPGTAFLFHQLPVR